jgi:hypothetical protein
VEPASWSCRTSWSPTRTLGRTASAVPPPGGRQRSLRCAGGYCCVGRPTPRSCALLCTRRRWRRVIVCAAARSEGPRSGVSLDHGSLGGWPTRSRWSGWIGRTSHSWQKSRYSLSMTSREDDEGEPRVRSTEGRIVVQVARDEPKAGAGGGPASALKSDSPAVKPGGSRSRIDRAGDRICGRTACRFPPLRANRRSEVSWDES